jgi:2-polyprenyl-6-methoxyphenol hydroxylase-like FAD-dependent oxidoreductase
MVGASLAAALPSSLSVAVIESFPTPAEKTVDAQDLRPSFDNRATALSKSSQHFFESIGLWSALVPFCETIKDVHVSDKGFWGSVLLSEAQETMSELGFVIENKALGRLIFSHLQGQNNIQCISPAKVCSIDVIASGVRLNISRENHIDDMPETALSAKLAIVADGANSDMCKKLGIKIQTHDYEHSAIISNIATSSEHNHIAYERFTKTGPMALLPLLSPEKGLYRSGLVWTLPSSEAQQIMAFIRC